jgi:hypothetical protein
MMDAALAGVPAGESAEAIIGDGVTEKNLLHGHIRKVKKKKTANHQPVVPAFSVMQIMGPRMLDHEDDMKGKRKITSLEVKSDELVDGEIRRINSYIGSRLLAADTKRYKAAGLLLYRFVGGKLQVLLGYQSKKGHKLTILVGGFANVRHPYLMV